MCAVVLFLTSLDDPTETLMERKDVHKFLESVPLTSWSEALLLLLLVDVLPLSRLAGLEAKRTIRRDGDEQNGTAGAAVPTRSGATTPRGRNHALFHMPAANNVVS